MKTKRTDWKAIQADYCARVKSLRQIASEHGISHVAIIKQAHRHGWVRSETSKLQATNGKQVGSKAIRHRSVNGSPPGNLAGNPVKPIAARRGAPSRKTPELVERILAGIAEGKSTRAMCNEVGIGQRTVWDWLASDREFAQQYAHAKQSCADSLAEEILKIADDTSKDTYINRKGQVITNHKAIARVKLRVGARKWYASKLVPKKYGKLPLNIRKDSDSSKPLVKGIEVVLVPVKQS